DMELVEVVRRRAGERSWLFAINHTDTDARLAVSGVDLLGDTRCDGELLVPAGAVAVVREETAG
ncbi:hypothetical protein DLE60_26540, partial [Micromonospora globispora]|uniref:Beta-galactosidase C-terminal domain n=1 Tax=Micromonospora globispora TaxID=1450148 RepID=UPI000D80D5AA